MVPRSLASSLLIIIAVTCFGSFEAAAGFTIQDLGVVSTPGVSGATGNPFSGASGVNSSGWTSGMSGRLTSFGTTGVSVATEAAYGGTFQAASTPMNSSASFSTSINNAGSVAGSFMDSADNNMMHAFYTTSTGKSIDLGTLNTGSLKGGNAQANGINNANEVVGTGTLASGAQQAFRGSGGTITAINPLVAGGFSMGNGINDNGVVVGTSQYQGQVVHAFVANEQGTVTDIASRNTVLGFTSSTYGQAINFAGTVVGYGDVGGNEHAFLAPSTGSLVDLGTIDGKQSSYAYGVNDQNQVVGKLDNNGSGASAFLWDPTVGQMFDLASLLSVADRSTWQLSDATGINDLDQISGQGYINGQLHGFLLTPVSGQSLFSPNVGPAGVPAPPTIVLSGIGIAIAAGFARLRGGRTGGRATA